MDRMRSPAFVAGDKIGQRCRFGDEGVGIDLVDGIGSQRS